MANEDCSASPKSSIEASANSNEPQHQGLYTFDMRKLSAAMYRHWDHVMAVLDVDYAPNGTLGSTGCGQQPAFPILLLRQAKSLCPPATTTPSGSGIARRRDPGRLSALGVLVLRRGRVQFV